MDCPYSTSGFLKLKKTKVVTKFFAPVYNKENFVRKIKDGA